MFMKRTNAGFALLELMIATIILSGLIYMFISFTQNQQRQLNSENVGKHVAIVANDLLSKVSTIGTCDNGGTVNQPLVDCIHMSPSYQTMLKNDGLDPANAVVNITTTS